MLSFGSNMAGCVKVLILLAALLSIANCSVDYIYHKKTSLNAIKEGTSVTISCHFNGNKPRGSSRWTLKGEVVAIDCKVQPPGIGIITPTADCSPDSGNGTATLSFVIHRVSLDRDKDTWMCQNIDLNEKLHFPIRVEDDTVSYKTNCQDEKKTPFSVTANIGCTYPPGKVRWCLNNGTRSNCSDQNKWAASLFETAPVITQRTEECTNYSTPGVFKYKSTIEGKLAEGVDVDKYKMYYSMNGIDYNKIVILLQDIKSANYIKEISGICMDKLCEAAMVLYVLDIVYLVILTVLTLVYGTVMQRRYIKSVKKYLHPAFFAVTIIGYVLSLTSLVLFISTHLIFQVWIVDSVCVGVVGILTIFYSIVLYWFGKRRSLSDPVSDASVNRHSDRVKPLMLQSCHVKPNADGQTLLHNASINGHPDRVKSLLLQGCDVDEIDDTWCTPLHLAAQNCHLEIVQLLINAGAKADLRNKDGNTPLKLAKEGTYVAQYLEEHMNKLSGRLQSLKHIDLNDMKIQNLLLDEKIYPITQNNKRGRAVIITYDEWTTNEIETRAQHDQDNLLYLFRSLNFKSVVYKYKTKHEMICALNAECSHPDQERADAFILCVLTYGNKDAIVSSDGKEINVEDEIWSVFNGINCPKLLGKPKIFIMQACQLELEYEDTDGERTGFVNKSTSIGTVSSDRPKSKEHEQKHRLIAYVTVQDSNSKKTPSEGSLFIRQIVDVFSEQAHKEHIQDLFTMVCDKMREENDESVQIPQIDSTLAKKFFFFPGY